MTNERLTRLREFFHRLRSLFRATQLDTELDAEMAAHLELAIEENLQRGMPPEEARRQALIRFGGVEQAKERHRDAPGYLQAMGMRLRAGRDLNWSDAPDGPLVAILNRTAANYLWPGQDPIGQIALVNDKEARVVGVVSDVRESSLESRPGWQMYLSSSQN